VMDDESGDDDRDEFSSTCATKTILLEFTN